MEYYINYPKDNNIKEYIKCSAEFKATLIVESIKRLPVDEISKKQITKEILKTLKEETNLSK